MQDWLMIVIILAGAIVVTLLLYVLAHKKSIFKKREKKAKEPKTPKAAKKTKKTKKAPESKPQVEQPKSEVIFEEKVVQKKRSPVGTQEDYSPSIEFVKRGETYSPIASATMTRRRPRPQMPPTPPLVQDDFESFRDQHGYSKLFRQSIKDQIQNLSPELKAILFGNVLDRKDDE